MKRIAVAVFVTAVAVGGITPASAVDWKYYKTRSEVVEVKKNGHKLRLLGYTRNAGGGSRWCIKGRKKGNSFTGIVGRPTPDSGPVKRGTPTSGRLSLTKDRVRVTWTDVNGVVSTKGNRARPNKLMLANHQAALPGATKACGF